MIGFLLFVAGWGDAIWRTLAALWPGGGYGFAASLGFVLVACWALANSAHRKARWLAPQSWKAVGLWGLAGLGYTGALLCAVPVAALFPGRNGRPLGSTTDRPMWMEQHFDYCSGILPGALLAIIPVVVKLLVQRGTGRRRR